MIRIMFEKNGLGLAAPQVGLLDRIFVMRDPEKKSEGIIFVNPDIDYLGPKTDKVLEGCLSLPWSRKERRVEIERPTEAEFYFDSLEVEGERLKWRFEGINARCIQHEIDHLNGIMIFDYLNGTLLRKLYMEKYMKDRPRRVKLS